MDKLSYFVRICAVGIGFSTFGIGGFLLGSLVFPIIILGTRDKDKRRHRVRSTIRLTFKIFLELLEFLGIIRLVIHNLSKLDKLKGCLIICNHPTLIDVVIIMAYMKNVQCVVKKELWSNFFLGGVVRAAGYFRNDTDPELFLTESKRQLQNGENILIFPEGTRTKPGVPLKLARGLGNLALAANANIQSLVLKCNNIFLTKGQKWYRPPCSRTTLELSVGSYFSLDHYDDHMPRSLRVRALMKDVQTYYNRTLNYE
ncbi:MAG: 1-acyl-sn-glycerol-3-phosphate acyltransferase [Candidatus Paracaedibacteraceae bacterium]|nr:1-acyl-sn-glycerol-3-phosphate acyltransferase [Candidatus Paracaedibacteraceae bacterium]